MSTSLTPPGWYPDPDGSPRLRFWTGSAWSDHVSVPAPLPPPPSPDAHRIPWRKVLPILAIPAVLVAGCAAWGLATTGPVPEKRPASVSYAIDWCQMTRNGLSSIESSPDLVGQGREADGFYVVILKDGQSCRLAYDSSTAGWVDLGSVTGK